MHRLTLYKTPVTIHSRHDVQEGKLFVTIISSDALTHRRSLHSAITHHCSIGTRWKWPEFGFNDFKRNFKLHQAFLRVVPEALHGKREILDFLCSREWGWFPHIHEPPPRYWYEECAIRGFSWAMLWRCFLCLAWALRPGNQGPGSRSRVQGARARFSGPNCRVELFNYWVREKPLRVPAPVPTYTNDIYRKIPPYTKCQCIRYAHVVPTVRNRKKVAFSTSFE